MMITETIFSKTATTVCSDICYASARMSLSRVVFNVPAVFGPGPSIQNKMVTNQQMDDVAAKLGTRWKTLATHLEMKAAELREIETDSEDVDMQAKLLLVAWQDREGNQATVDNLAAALNVAGFSQIAENLSEG